MRVDLSLTSNRDYRAGRSFFVRATWQIVEALVLLNPTVVSYSFKRWVLRRFGAQVGSNVLIKPHVHVKHPWRLTIGDNSWVGERAWIDNMEQVDVGSNVVISQGAYICTGNHDWSDPGMGLTPRPIRVEDGAWIGAFAKVGPGRTIGRESIITLGSVVTSDTEPSGIYTGNPAEKVGERVVRDVPGPARVDPESG